MPTNIPPLLCIGETLDRPQYKPLLRPRFQCPRFRSVLIVTRAPGVTRAVAANNNACRIDAFYSTKLKTYNKMCTRSANRSGYCPISMRRENRFVYKTTGNHSRAYWSSVCIFQFTPRKLRRRPSKGCRAKVFIFPNENTVLLGEKNGYISIRRRYRKKKALRTLCSVFILFFYSVLFEKHAQIEMLQIVACSARHTPSDAKLVFTGLTPKRKWIKKVKFPGLAVKCRAITEYLCFIRVYI